MPTQRKIDRLGLRVLRDVGQRLLCDPKTGDLDRGWDSPVHSFDRERKGPSITRRLAVRIPSKCRHQTQIIKERRSQVKSQRPHLSQQAVHQLKTIRERTETGIPDLAMLDVLQVDLQCRQQLSDFVVQIARKSASLLFLHLHQSARKYP